MSLHFLQFLKKYSHITVYIKFITPLHTMLTHPAHNVITCNEGRLKAKFGSRGFEHDPSSIITAHPENGNNHDIAGFSFTGGFIQDPSSILWSQRIIFS